MKKTMYLIVCLSILIACKKEDKIEAQVSSDETKAVLSEEVKTVEGGFSEVALSEKVMGVDGVEYTLYQVLQKYKGKTILIDIWASWCPDCIKGMPKVHQLQNEFQEVVYVFLSFDKTEQDWRIGMNKYKTIGENFLMKSDWKTGKLKEEIDLDWIPRYMVVDKQGRIILHKAIEADDPKLISILNELKNNK